MAMKYTPLSNSADEAGYTAADTLTAQIRETALERGWSPEAASALSVSYTDKDFSVVVDPSKKDLVDDLEYGTEKLPPNPVVRSFSLTPTKVESTFVSSLEEKLGWKL